MPITTNSSPFEICMLLLVMENEQSTQNSLHSTYKKLTSNVNIKTPVSLKSGLKSKVHAKAMVFPVVMYGCENWTVKKADR